MPNNTIQKIIILQNMVHLPLVQILEATYISLEEEVHMVIVEMRYVVMGAMEALEVLLVKVVLFSITY